MTKPSPEAIVFARYIVDTDMQYAAVGCPGVEPEILEATLKVLRANVETQEEDEPDGA